MKNVVIDLRWVRDTNLDGISRYAIEVVERLLKENQGNFDYMLLFDKKDVFKMVCSLLPKKPYRIYKVGFPVFSYKEPFLLPRILKSLDADLFFAPNYITYPFNGRTKIILVIHDLTQYVSPETLEANIRWKIFFKFKFQTKHILDRTNLIVTDSEQSKLDIINLFKTKEEKIAIIYPGVDGQFFVRSSIEKKAEVRKRYRLPERFIVSVSRQDPRKNLPNLIKSYNNLPEGIKSGYKLVIAGSKHPRFYPKLEFLVRKFKLQKNVLFTGYIKEEDLPTLYELSDLVVYPSFYEGFGLPVLEGMACGVPVISSNTSSLPEVAGDAALMVDPHRNREITNAMAKVLTDKY